MLTFKLEDLKAATNNMLEVLSPNVFYQGKCLGTVIDENVYCSNTENQNILINLNLQLKET